MVDAFFTGGQVRKSARKVSYEVLMNMCETRTQRALNTPAPNVNLATCSCCLRDVYAKKL